MGYYLCRFEKDDGDGIETAVTWVDGTEAEVGTVVYSVNGEQGKWTLTHVGDLPITREEYLKLNKPKLELVKKAS
jgi:hypothetical protein